jgi:hypothetical protein
MDWCERLTEFCEGPYAETRAKLKVDGERLHSLMNAKSRATLCSDLQSPIGKIHCRFGVNLGGIEYRQIRVVGCDQ